MCVNNIPNFNLSVWLPESVYPDHVAVCRNGPSTPAHSVQSRQYTNIVPNSPYRGGLSTQRSSANNYRASQVSGSCHEYELETVDSYVECPLCGELFSSQTIEVHAAVCCEMSMVY